MTDCYASTADKLQKFPAVIGQIYDLAAAGIDDPILFHWLLAAGAADVRGLAALTAMHDAARAGAYVTPAQMNCDPPQTVAHTILNGGDCDQWAAVLLAGAAALGIRAELLTFGDDADPYQHVAICAQLDGEWYALDPKGDRAGLPFGAIDHNYAEIKAWQPWGPYAA